MLIGVVGKSNVGKSTFFRAATLAPAEIGPYPFVTIKPNRAVGYARTECPCNKMKLKCSPKKSPCVNGFRFVPFEMIDVAGLIPGAHEGLGLGNQFLDDLRQADAMIHVIDASGGTDEKGNPVPEGSRELKEDILFLEKEFDFWLKGILSKRFIRKNDQKVKREEIEKSLTGLKIFPEHIKNAEKICGLTAEEIKSWKDEDLLKFCVALRNASKPMVICANKCDVSIARENVKELEKNFPSEKIVPACSEAELVLREASEKKIVDYVPGESDFVLINEVNTSQKKALDFVRQKVLNVLGCTGVQKTINKAVFELMKNIVVYPVEDENKLTDGKGNVLPDAFLLPEDSTALDLAKTIHTDIGERFIGAIDCKTKRKIGKETMLKNGDIIKILTRR